MGKKAVFFRWSQLRHGQNNAFTHREQTEVFYIVEGEGLIYMNEEEFLARKGDAFICSPGDEHNLWNQSGEDFSVVVFRINKPEEGDTNRVDEEEWEPASYPA